MILQIEDPKNSTKKLLEQINIFSKVARYRINNQKLIAFLYINKELLGKIRENQIYNCIKNNNRIFRNKFNQGGKKPELRKLQNDEERNYRYK